MLAGVVSHKVFSIVLLGVVGLRNPEQLMRLQAKSPPRVSKTVLQRQLGIAFSLRTIHRLQEKLLEIEVSKELRLGTVLGKDELQFTALPEGEGRASLGTDTDPVNARWRKQRSICLNSNLKSFCMQGLNKRRIKLEQGFAACTHDKRDTVRSTLSRPCGSNSPSQIASGYETPAPGAVRPNEIGITELTDRRSPVLLQP